MIRNYLARRRRDAENGTAAAYPAVAGWLCDRDGAPWANPFVQGARSPSKFMFGPES